MNRTAAKFLLKLLSPFIMATAATVLAWHWIGLYAVAVFLFGLYLSGFLSSKLTMREYQKILDRIILEPISDEEYEDEKH